MHWAERENSETAHRGADVARKLPCFAIPGTKGAVLALGLTIIGLERADGALEVARHVAVGAESSQRCIGAARDCHTV